MPPTPEDHFPVLDAEDDSYLVLPLDDHHIDHLHIAPTHTFQLSRPLEKEAIDYLHTRLAIAQKKEANYSGTSSTVRYGNLSIPSKTITELTKN